MKFCYLLICFNILLSSCELPQKLINIDTDVYLLLRDGHGSDLLNPTTQGYKNPENIKLYYLLDGEKIEIYNPAYDLPRNFMVFKNEGNGEYAMKFFPNEQGVKTGDISTVYIKWSDTDEDTVKCHMVHFETKDTEVITIAKIWYNDKLKYDDQVNGKVNWSNSVVDRLIKVDK